MMHGRIKGADSTINAILRTAWKLLNDPARASQLSQELPNVLEATPRVVVESSLARQARLFAVKAPFMLVYYGYY